MGFLESLVNLLTKLICGASGANEQPSQQSHQAPQPHRPQQQHGGYADHARPHGQQQQQQQHPHQQQQQHQQQQYPPTQHHAPSPPAQRPTSPPVKTHPGHRVRPGQRVDLNQENQHDPHYMDLRARANAAGDAMARAFDGSHSAYASGDGARAKQLSEEGKRHQREMEALNGQASEWIFVENNKDSGPGEVDLHGLYVKEAIHFTDRAIQDARSRGDSEIHLIVGKGLHSRGGIAKLKPAIEELIRKHQLVAALDPQNAGVLIVHLDGRAGGDRSVGADEITRKLERDEEACIIM